jgi:ABC-type Mn2+/Zn2+ transport system permease subunit
MNESLIFSVITGAAVGLSAGYLGSLMLLKKMALIGHALSHVALPGLALGILFSFNPFLGAVSSVLRIIISASIGGTISAGVLVVIVGAVFFLGSWIVNIKMQAKFNVAGEAALKTRDKNI